MIRCLVVDDEPLAIEIITDYIEKIPSLELAKSTTSAFEAIQFVQNNPVDLIFLDVQMPELTGIQFLKVIDGKCPVILTTAFPEYALESYELQVTDYLLKPIAFDRFYKAVQKVLGNKQEQKSESQAQSVPAQPMDFIFVKTEHKILKVNLDDILYIEGLKDYISIFTAAERIITLQNMRKMEETLPVSKFVRVHRSYIVPLDKIEFIERSRIRIKDQIIPIGDTYRDNFFKRIGGLNV